MLSDLSASARRMQEVLQEHGLDCQVVELPDSTRTAPEAAASIGCQVAQIVKSLVFRGRHTDRPILVIASGANRVNEKRLGELAGEPVEKASADFVRERTGFAIGGVPPLGHAEPLLTFIDQDLLRYDIVWAAAGTPHAVFRLTPSQLIRVAGGEVTPIT